MSDAQTADFITPWRAVELSRGEALAKEMQRELSSGHVLHGRTFAAIAERRDCDDVLFHVEDSPVRYAVAHLSYSVSRGDSPRWPTTEFFDSIGQFIETRMKRDSIDFETG